MKKNRDSKQLLFEMMNKIDPTFKPVLNEMFDNSKFPKDISLEQTIDIAKKVAEIISKEGKGIATVNMKSIEPASFDLDFNNVEYDGGSYNINDNGDVVNMALPEKPIVYNWKNELNEDSENGGDYADELGAIAYMVILSHLSDSLIEIGFKTEVAKIRLNFIKFIINKLHGNLNIRINPSKMFKDYVKEYNVDTSKLNEINSTSNS